MTDYEWDENKNMKTFQERGFDFDYASRIFDGPVVEWESPREGEHRTKATGMVAGRYITVIYTWRGGRRRIISARPARRDEKDAYAQNS